MTGASAYNGMFLWASNWSSYVPQVTGSGTVLTVAAGTFTGTTGSYTFYVASADMYAALQTSAFTPPTNYWVECSIRMNTPGIGTGVIPVNGFGGLSGCCLPNQAYVGSSAGARIANDGFVSTNTLIFQNWNEYNANPYSEWMQTELATAYAGQYIDLACKVFGAGAANPVVYTYWKFDWEDVTEWKAASRFISSSNGGAIGLVAWYAAVEVASLVVRPLIHYTS